MTEILGYRITFRRESAAAVLVLASLLLASGLLGSLDVAQAFVDAEPGSFWGAVPVHYVASGVTLLFTLIVVLFMCALVLYVGFHFFFEIEEANADDE